jgi:hypothetical protein
MVLIFERDVFDFNLSKYNGNSIILEKISSHNVGSIYLNQSKFSGRI